MTVRMNTYVWRIALGCRSDLHSVEKLNVASNILDMHFDFRDCILRCSLKSRSGRLLKEITFACDL